MNERIKELEKQSLDYFWSLDDSVRTTDTFTANSEFTKKFAELIVKECVGLCDKAAEENARTFYTVTETQEVGPALVSKGSQVQAEKLSWQIKQHFGVEE